MAGQVVTLAGARGWARFRNEVGKCTGAKQNVDRATLWKWGRRKKRKQNCRGWSAWLFSKPRATATSFTGRCKNRTTSGAGTSTSFEETKRAKYEILFLKLLPLCGEKEKNTSPVVLTLKRFCFTYSSRQMTTLHHHTQGASDHLKTARFSFPGSRKLQVTN